MHCNQFTVRVAWGDCDPAGIVFFPNYFAFCNEATGALFESVGLPKPLLLKTYEIVGYPVVEVNGAFFRPSVFGDTLVIDSTIVEWGRSSFKLLHRLLKEGALAVEVREKRVWSAHDPDKPGAIRAKPIPEELKARFSPDAVKSQSGVCP